jgi:ERI1 exoribonuclease 2
MQFFGTMGLPKTKHTFGGNKMGKYVVIDLEMCAVHNKKNKQIFNSGTELIQIGAVILDQDYRIVDTYSTYVCPEFGNIDRYINRLTGISTKDTLNAQKSNEALADFAEWLPADATMVAWSECDEIQIKKELDGKGIDNPKLRATFGHWIDCQALFGQRMENERKYKLSEALLITGLWSDGKAHDALIDARNTAYVFAKLEQEECIRPNYLYMSEKDAHSYVFNPFARYCNAY